MLTGNIPDNMNAMVLENIHEPLVHRVIPVPFPDQDQVLIRVIACGICRTDLHIVDGELGQPELPLIPGHEVIGEIVLAGQGVQHLKNGDIVGVPWLAYTCGHCKFCSQGRENLCLHALFTGFTVNGGYAEYMVAWAGYCFLMPELYANPSGAPMLCAGLIGFRSWRMINRYAENIGIYGFGAAAHILAQIASYQQKLIYAFARPGDGNAVAFAYKMGAAWAGTSADTPPIKLDAAIIFAPDGTLVPLALSHLDKGGMVICGGIHMSDIPGFSYDTLWEERTIKSVANLTREDGNEFFKLAQKIPVVATVKYYSLAEANQALNDLRTGQVTGAAVLLVSMR